MNHYENIPEELKTLAQWVCTRDGSKVPMKAFENEAASSTNSSTWSDFSTALNAVENGHYDYCGFVFNDNGIVGIDIDTGYDEDGLMSQQIFSVIARAIPKNPRADEDFIFSSEGRFLSRARTTLQE